MQFVTEDSSWDNNLQAKFSNSNKRTDGHVYVVNFQHGSWMENIRNKEHRQTDINKCVEEFICHWGHNSIVSPFVLDHVGQIGDEAGHTYLVFKINFFPLSRN